MNRLFNKTPEGVELKPEEIDTIIKKRGAHIAETGARVDFECDINIAAYFPKLLEEYNRKNKFIECLSNKYSISLTMNFSLRI